MSPDLESPPLAATQIFGERVHLAAEYARLLSTDAVLRGLIGPREVPRLWTRHLINCAAIAPLIPPESWVCDLGSGAGLPGIPLALARPDLRVTLLEPLLRRATFLSEVVAALGLTNVEVDRGRAEERRGVIRAQSVVVRAVAPLDKLIGWALPLLAPGGQLLALKGAGASDELALVRSRLRRAGVEEAHVEVLDAVELAGVSTVVRMTVSDVGNGQAARPSRGARHG